MSNNNQLIYLYAYDSGLKYLNVKNGNNGDFQRMRAYNNNLTCIQVDDVTQAQMNSNWQIDGGTNYSMDCSGQWEVYLPDSNLAGVLYSNYLNVIDQDMDGIISFAEAGAYNGTLDFSNQGITDVTGLQAFTGATEINVSGNAISDLSPLFQTNAVIISKASGNQKTTASLAPTSLQVLNCSNNSLINLDVSSISTLTTLDCSNNQLVYLNVQNNANLITFDATTNDSGLCINVDSPSDANAGLNPYTSWAKDGSATYSDSCTPALGIPENRLAQLISMYPNPSHGKITIDTKETINYRILSLQGQEIMQGNLSLGIHDLDISSLSKGLYLLNFESLKGKMTKKLIKQ